MNQYKEHIKRLRDDYNAAVWASSPFYDESEDYRSWELDYEAHADACAHIIADAYRNGDTPSATPAASTLSPTRKCFTRATISFRLPSTTGRSAKDPK